jgi:transcription elongation factor GreA
MCVATRSRHRARVTIGHDERHALTEELDLLRERRREIEDSLEVEDRPDDIGDQSEATQRRDELDWIDRRIRDIVHLIHVVDRHRDHPPDRVGVGSLVTLRYADGRFETLQVTAVPDEDIPTVTLNSPLGRALLGAAVGEEVTWVTSDGRLRARVEDITAPTDRPLR